MTIVDLQGNLNREYVVGFYFSLKPRRPKFATGFPESEEENLVRLANAGFKAGVRTTTEVLDAELDLFRARAGIVTTQLNCAEAKTKLELATGENL